MLENEGWIKLHRKFMTWEWYTDDHMVRLFVHLLLEANHKPQRWRGILIERGQLVTGRFKLSENTGISEQSIRTCLNRLKSTSEITIKSTSKYSIITICNYNKYNLATTEINQQINQQSNQQLTSNQPATNHKQELKNDKNEKKKNNIAKEIFDYWNGLFHDTHLEIKKLTDARKRKINTRTEESSFDYKEIFQKVVDSKFLTDPNKEWKGFCFDWVIANDHNYIKILEGKYSDKE